MKPARLIDAAGPTVWPSGLGGNNDGSPYIGLHPLIEIGSSVGDARVSGRDFCEAMMDGRPSKHNGGPHVKVEKTGKILAPAAQRALAEAALRHQMAGSAQPGEAPREVAGRGGLEPVRYGDWEIKGLASDF